MKTVRALLVVLTGVVAGLTAGALSGPESAVAGTPLALLARWSHAPWSVNRSGGLESRLEELQVRSAQLATMQSQLEELQHRVEGVDGAKAFAEARKLGIIDAVSQMNPDLRPSTVRRVGVALVSEARKNNLDPLLLAALARVESGFDPFATSDAGARGLLQLTPPTGRSLASLGGTALSETAELYDIETNISLGARYLRSLTRQFATIDAALLAYNRGVGGARAVLKSPEEGRRALAGYPRAVLSERARMARRALELADNAAL